MHTQNMYIYYVSIKKLEKTLGKKVDSQIQVGPNVLKNFPVIEQSISFSIKITVK